VLPYLKSQGHTQIDLLIVSHSDMDHAGGVATLLKEMPIDTDQIFVVDHDYQYIGAIHISILLTHEAEQNIAPLINKDLRPIPVDTTEKKVADLFEQRDLISAVFSSDLKLSCCHKFYL